MGVLIRTLFLVLCLLFYTNAFALDVLKSTAGMYISQDKASGGAAGLASLSQTAQVGVNAESQSFHVGNDGGGTLSYIIADNASWLSCDPTSGEATTEQDLITINYVTTKLKTGIYKGKIYIRSDYSGWAFIDVYLTATVVY